MRRHSVVWIGALTALVLFGPGGAWAAPPAVGEGLPGMTLPAPAGPDHRAYLGLAGEGPFDAAAVRAEVLLIEVFSMYCSYCQKEAPEVNRLYERAGSSPDLRDRLRIIGIGVGNTALEVEVFRKKYAVPFPLFPDPDFTLHRALGEVRTPFFIVARRAAEGNGWVAVLTREGSMDGADPFLKRIREAAGLFKEDGS